MEKVLIVDDIPEYVETIEAYIEERASVLKAHSLSEAKSLIQANRIDLAIVDIRLDEGDPENRDGLELLVWLRKIFPKVGIIVMSAYKEFDYAVEALNAGADYFMRKPIDPDELNSIVDKIISGD